ncbi:diacylglycerol kinase [Sulfurospirillum arcachonense]|uniref:diacylglycerol kinase n=1 Tax=Sulfurospirillum arcachonense TaxID=57666 RepID=UPI00046A7908|nr:diacylglycerol kinase [Sulfurospirillum arcachonense]
MRNQPKYNLFKNTIYALKGLKDIIQNESSFKIELLLACVMGIIIVCIDVTVVEKLLLFITLMGILIAEAINSAIERVVDLVTLKHNKMAGRAKDVGSAVVFLSIILCISVWFAIFYTNFNKIF